MDLSGTWEGYYLNPEVGEGEFPIEAVFSVESGRLTGTMSDGRRSWSVAAADISETLPKGSKDALLWEEFARHYPEAVLTTHLPKESVLKGKVDGRSVRFRKQYQGPSLVSYAGSGISETAEEPNSDLLEYVGTAREDGSMIEGRWRIYNKSFLGLTRRIVAEGEFRLRRVDSGKP